MKDRNRLHLSKLDEFAAFCEADGWRREAPKGNFEVLRMRNPEWSGPLLVHARANETGYLTVHLHSRSMLDRFLGARAAPSPTPPAAPATNQPAPWE